MQTFPSGATLTVSLFATHPSIKIETNGSQQNSYEDIQPLLTALTISWYLDVFPS